MDEVELLRLELKRERQARKQAEELLEQKSLELYQRNTELETEISERVWAGEELQRQAEALKHSNAELEQFAYVASHDLQAPLRTIASFAQLLTRSSRDKLDSEAIEYLDYINSGAKRLQRLINDLLDFSRTGRATYVLDWFSSQQLMVDLCRQLSGSLEAAGAQVIFDNLPMIYADRTQILRLLQNLLDNAIKFRKPGQSPRVEIRCTELAEHWQFEVRDQGIGIAPEYQTKIFGVFTRLHTDEEYPGTGVGLPICKKIAERHGGKLWLESVEGGGCRFFFTLPRSVTAV